ncbi:MAG: 50S ribosomal protein L11 methyltransferase [Pseudomonas sp.]|nr:50S ribosomal protein L11 methyltransferase [Pseudomonas sp.]
MQSSLITQLNSALQTRIGDAQLIPSALPQLPLKLWLIDPSSMQRQFSPQETQRILDEPPYWCFCWASGLALAQWILQHPEQVAGKRVIDVGAGSGIVALAAQLAGAKTTVACDLDPIALQACRANAELNQLELSYSDDLFSESDPYDVLFAADVLYDAANLPLLNRFPDFAKQIIIADSRQRNFQHPLFIKSQTLYGETLPDLAEPEEFRQVSVYQSI